MSSDQGPAPVLRLPVSADATVALLNLKSGSGRDCRTASSPGANLAGRSRPGPLTADERRAVPVLNREHFVGSLRREMRRADRSEAALSLVIYRLAQGSGSTQADELRQLLASSVRETDILGQLGATAFAVICTDTGDEGVHHFIAKIDELSDHLHYSVESATYPDHLFEGFAADPSAAHGPSPLFLHERRRPHLDTYFLKRPLDIAGALLALLLFSPLMLLTALAVKLTSKGPVIFRQTRLGRGGRPFAFYKFRSMVVNNDDRIHREYVASLIKGEHGKVEQPGRGDDGLRFKIKADPRITWIGRIIRKTSIDELPQLFNVLKGDMSLVGPRPPLPYEAENYKSWHLRRVLDIRPGITGLWQVEGRSRVTFEDMVRMDLRYLRSCSLGLDLKLLAKTVVAVAKCDGAG